MDRISELRRIIEKQLSWHKSRLDCFIQMLLSLFTVKTVSLSELAVAMESEGQIASRNKRLYRFFAFFEIDFGQIAQWLFSLFFDGSRKVYIAIDRTNWKWGRAHINIFMLSICFEGIAIPILWKVFSKGGLSTGQEQIDLCKRFVDRFGLERIEGLLGDREFANGKFIRWLVKSKIPFYIRLKNNTQVYHKKKKYTAVAKLFSRISVYEHKVYGMRMWLFGESLYLTASKNERGELMIIVTNANYKSAVPIYLRRWEIESLFQALKGRGFRFEDTHMTEPCRIEKMIALLAVGVAWAHKVGEWRSTVKAIPMKLFKTQRRPQYSFFRYGLDLIRDIITGLKTRKKLFKNCLKCLDFPYQEAKS